MTWLMFLLYIVQPAQTQAKYDAVLAKKYYASQTECANAGKALIESLSKDERVVQIVAGTCVPASSQQANAAD